jgi:hypothetical protein
MYNAPEGRFYSYKERVMTKSKVIFLGAVVSCGIFAMDRKPAEDISKNIIVPRRSSRDTTPPPIDMTAVEYQRARDANSLPEQPQKSPTEKVHEYLLNKAQSKQQRDFKESFSAKK